MEFEDYMKNLLNEFWITMYILVQNVDKMKFLMDNVKYLNRIRGFDI